MANTSVILSGFSYGELDPKLAARVGFAGYTKSVKTASNVLSIPQGGFTRRFGTSYRVTSTATAKDYVALFAFLYDDLAIYNLVIEDLSIRIYLENTLQATVVTTYPREIVKDLYFVVVNERIIILHQNFVIRQLIRTASAANIITGVDAANDYITITNALTVGDIYPVKFTTAGTLPVSNPQIFVNTFYYIRVIAANSIRVYYTPTDATNNVNYFDIAAVGAGVSNVIVYNTWAISDVPISIYPAYDFDAFATYSAAGFTFTSSAVSGTVGVPLTITASAAVFTAAHVGGLFIGNGGIVRITVFTDTTHVNGYSYEDFTNTAAFPGKEAFLGEPAWSAARGYPRAGTFFQERFFVCGSRQIPNGVWGSTIFSVFDFDDSQQLDDSAISYYPASGQSNVFKAMTASKSLLVHSNTGNYSTSLTSENPLTPSTFTLVAQNLDGISGVTPANVDNQILYVDKSARNVKSMSWDIVQSSYVNTNISLTSAHLVPTPIDIAVYSEPEFTDGYYLICVNEDGTIGIYNSLIEQDIKGWTKTSTAQNNVAGVASPGRFRAITSAANKAWAVVERDIGAGSVFYVEELNFNVRTDSSVSYSFTVASATLTGLAHLNGQTLQVYGDGIYQGEFVVAAGTVTLTTAISNGFAGLSFRSLIEPHPVNIDTKKGPTLYQEVHIRNIYIHYFESIGMTFQGFDIPVINMQDVVLDMLATPRTGVFDYTLMEGWNSFTYDIQIIQDLPLPMTLLAIGYEVELS